jgi:hypothetical protein
VWCSLEFSTPKGGTRPSGFNTFHFRACTLSTSQPPKVVWTCGAFLKSLLLRNELPANGVHFFNISTAKSGPRPSFFFWSILRFSRRRHALFNHLNCQKCSECGVFCTFWRHNDVHFFNSSTSKSAPSMRSVLHFDFQISDGSASAALNGPDYVEIPSQTMLSKGAFNIRGMGLIYIYIFITNILSIYHIISYHVISFHIISYNIISCHIISYHIKSHHIISYLSLSVTNHQKHQPIIPSCPTVEWVTTRRLGESAPWEVMVSFLSGDVHETTCC